MSSPLPPEHMLATGATVVITHNVQADKVAAYEAWLDEIAPRCQASQGHLDWHIVRPIVGRTSIYRVIIRFDSEENLRGWMLSPLRAQLISKAQPFFVHGDDYTISSDLDFWFAPANAKPPVPVRWKQYLVTWSAIYPLVMSVPLIVLPLLGLLGLDHHRWLTTLVMTGTVVFLMVYVVMPRYTQLIRRWLFAR